MCRGMEHATQQVILETIRSVNRADRYTHTHTQIERDIYIRTRARFERCSTGFRFQLLDPPASSFGISLPRGWQIPRLEARERAPSLPTVPFRSVLRYVLPPPSLPLFLPLHPPLFSPPRPRPRPALYNKLFHKLRAINA